MEEISVYQILTDLGYQLKDCGKEFRAKPLYRDSDNDTVLRIYKDTGNWVDFKENISGDINSLVNLTLKLESPIKAQEWLKNKNFVIAPSIQNQKPIIKSTKKFDLSLLLKLEDDQSYWIKRKVNKEALYEFKGGVAKAGKMKNRYVFPILNSKKDIVGFSGRDLNSQSKIKWKHLGEKINWCYPLFLNIDEIQTSKEVFLVESIGDCLSLWESGIKNTIVTFGLEVSLSIRFLTLSLYSLSSPPSSAFASWAGVSSFGSAKAGPSGSAGSTTSALPFSSISTLTSSSFSFPTSIS
jgi:hypothetical protein